MEKVQTSKMDVPACPSQFMAIFMEQIIGFKPWDVDFFQWIPSMAMRMSPASHCSGRLARTSSKNWVSKITPSEARSKLFGTEIQLYPVIYRSTYIHLYIDPLISTYIYIDPVISSYSIVISSCSGSFHRSFLGP